MKNSNKLFSRRPPQEYLQEWSKVLAETKRDKAEKQPMIFHFRLGKRHYGLPVKVIKKVTSKKNARAVPHLPDHLFKGLANVDGDLLLYVSLESALGLRAVRGSKKTKRTVVIEVKNEDWAFTVDEVFGIKESNDEIVNLNPEEIFAKVKESIKNDR